MTFKWGNEEFSSVVSAPAKIGGEFPLRQRERCRKATSLKRKPGVF